MCLYGIKQWIALSYILKFDLSKLFFAVIFVFSLLLKIRFLLF